MHFHTVVIKHRSYIKGIKTKLQRLYMIRTHNLDMHVALSDVMWRIACFLLPCLYSSAPEWVQFDQESYSELAIEEKIVQKGTIWKKKIQRKLDHNYLMTLPQYHANKSYSTVKLEIWERHGTCIEKKTIFRGRPICFSQLVLTDTDMQNAVTDTDCWAILIMTFQQSPILYFNRYRHWYHFIQFW